jgi:TPR repeat protein
MLRTTAAIITFGAIAGCGFYSDPPRLPAEVRKALDNPSSVTLYSTQPWGGPDLTEWDFHGQHQNGHVELKNEKAGQAIAALNTAISRGVNKESLCLINPRHGLRVVSSGSTYDILICYECGQLQLYKNDQPLPFSGSLGGNPDALNRLLEREGIPLANDSSGLQASYAAEAKLALQRAGEGDPKAQELIGKYLLSGRGLAKDKNRGIEWLAKSYGTSLDSSDFEVKLGNMFAHSRDMQPDYPRSMKFFRSAADQGNAEGQFQVGSLYELGEGVEKDRAEALRWFRQAASQGNPKAEYRIGVAFAKAWNIKQDYAEALAMFRKAAEQGHPEAMNWIGSIYSEGWGVGKDPGEAYFWFRLARKFHALSVEQPPDVSPAAKAAAEQRVAAWVASHVACLDDCHTWSC